MQTRSLCSPDLRVVEAVSFRVDPLRKARGQASCKEPRTVGVNLQLVGASRNALKFKIAVLGNKRLALL